ncbi:MAG: DNA gyrase subunit A [Saprospiraceae bacterium]|nr:DNA gyrase subunit A [Saprospiraceae bacterium]MBK8112990.1 DNA gyrase subunit A [Saprospiraceae bacterium]
MSDNQKIITINIEDEMKTAYIDYSMSVIVARALPDVRDGLKPVHRRVLYGMSELGVGYNKAHKKSARIVGEVLGKYHPHGDSSVYDTMVRMAQPWSLRYKLVDGQGNFGSMDGDSPAAMRYTEARLERIADEILGDLDKETVDFANNFDDSLEEPTVMPSKIPNLIINGASGIAVGMATNMLPHNLTEVIDGIIATINNPEISIDEIITFIKAPDFPTGGIIYGMSGVKEAFHTGRGRVVVRGKAHIESDNSGRETIIISEIPYQVNKAGLVEKIAEMMVEEKITGISTIRDESDRNGLRVVVEVKKDAMASVVLSKLYKFTPLQTSYGVNNIALVNGRPRLLNIRQMIDEFVKFRIEVIVRRTRYELRKAEERAHILAGLLIALAHIDEVIAIIRSSATVDEAKDGLIANFELSEIQAKAILEMRLQRLVSLEVEKIQAEYDELIKIIEHYKAVLASEDMQKDIVRKELADVKDRFGDARRTAINYSDDEISIEDLIPNEHVAITISHSGYIKRTRLMEYKQQSRGGRGSRGSKTKDEDYVEHLLIGYNHNHMLVFTELGRCFWLRVFDIPEATKTSLGKAIQNIIQIPSDDKIRAYILVESLEDKEFLNSHYLIFCTKKGIIKKTVIEAFSRPRSSGINAISINEGDQLIEVRLTNGKNEIILANRNGRAIRFSENDVRDMGRGATGVGGMRLDEDPDDQVVGMVTVDPEDPTTTIFVASEKGNGKRSSLEDYRVTKRKGKGVKTLQVTEKTGKIVAIKVVHEDDDMLISTSSGIMIRMAAGTIRVSGRATQGVKVIRLDDQDSIADIAVVKNTGEEAEEAVIDPILSEEMNLDIIPDDFSAEEE